MPEVNAEFIERYQTIYQKDPTSRVFAPLAEAYRRMGHYHEAENICARGTRLHPNFAGGYVALGRIYFDQEKLDDAMRSLLKATSLAPENLLAQRLLGEIALKLKRPKEALAAFKMVLFFNPNDQKAVRVVKSLESFTADEFSDDLFSMAPSTSSSESDFLSKQAKVDPHLIGEPAYKIRSLERALSLADAFIVRNETDKARTALNKALHEIGEHPEINKRITLLDQQVLAPMPEITRLSPEVKTLYLSKKALLEKLLTRISARRIDS